jgi:hypothetical protein
VQDFSETVNNPETAKRGRESFAGTARRVLRTKDSRPLFAAKWLHAGVLEDGSVSYPESGSPQGGVISPLLSNIFLHYVLDEWFEREVKPCLKGRAYLIRFADDFVIGFTHEADARRVREVLPKRFGKYGLTIHPAKTRLVPFRHPERRADGPDESNGPGTFDLLGFTHYWGRSYALMCARTDPWEPRAGNRPGPPG